MKFCVEKTFIPLSVYSHRDYSFKDEAGVEGPEEEGVGCLILLLPI